MIKLEGITKSFGSLQVLKGIDLEINKGEIVSIVGPSGAGKTTILNLLGGMDQATSGSIMVDGQDVALYDEKKLTQYRRDDIGFVFQFYNLVQNLTALENVELATQICKNSLNPKEVLEKVGLKDRMKNFPSQLSGGEQQRVAIARAIAAKPPVILADEPTGNLDSASTKEIMEILRGLHDSGRSVILITHDNDIADQAKRVIRILDGKIVENYYNELEKE